MSRVVAAALLVVAAFPAAAQFLQPFFPVGIVVGAAGGVLPDRRELQSLAKMRFNVIGFRDGNTRELRVVRLAALLDSEPGREPLPIPSTGLASVSTWKNARDVRLHAWHEMAKGARGILFDLGMSYTSNQDTLEAASEFADNVTRNAALFAPLRPRESAADIRIVGPSGAIDARFLESNVALVLIAVNQTAEIHRVTLKFSSNIPEAIWQNMETGAAVNFVASAEGPAYTRTFTPFDVIVLMIRKQYK